MTYVDRYGEYLDGLPLDLARARNAEKMLALGYTSNLDVLLNWDMETFNGIVHTYLEQEPSFAEGETIDSLGNFARIVSYFLIRGLGGEIDITSLQVCSFLEQRFPKSFALGGTSAQGSAALGAMGCPLVTHLSDSSEAVCRLMDYPGIFLVQDKTLVPILQGASGGLPVKHYILQFNKGDVLVINDQKFVVPVSNRLILDYDLIHKRLPIQKDFMDYLENHARKFYAYSISGFNLIVNQGVLETSLPPLEEHYRKVKEANPDCLIYLEAAHYQNSRIKKITFDRLAKQIDVLGINEEELLDLGDQIGLDIDNTDLKEVLRGLDGIAENFDLKGIVLHTKDYALYFGDQLKGYDLEKGLTLGNIMAGTKARIGVYGSLQDCRESLALELSPIGVAFAAELKTLETRRYTCLVPSRYMKYPASTIGLGDTFVAGMQLGFIR